MKVIYNGMDKEINILKHFNLNADEYIIYEYAKKIYLGQISDNKIIIPNGNMDVLKILISNFISSNYNDNINKQNNCVILDNKINENVEEVSAQPLAFTDIQLSNLKNERIIKTNTIEKEDKKTTKIVPIIIVILFIALLVVGVFLFKDKIFKNGSSDPKTNQNDKNTSNDDNNTIQEPDNIQTYKTDATIDELFERANQATYNADVNAYISIYPSFMHEEVKKEVTSESLTQQYNKLKQEYGEDAKVTYNITKQTKKEDSWMVKNNEYLQDHYKTTIKMTECYELEGTITKTGSLKTDVIGKDGSTNPFYEVWYCKFSDGTTGIVTG